MLNRKTALLLLLFAGCICACKITTIPFDPDKVNNSFFTKVPQLWIKTLNANIDSVKIYQATLQEVVVDRDDIPEFRIVNTESKQKLVTTPEFKNYHQLFLYQVYAGKSTFCVYLGSSFNVDDVCTKLGPAYLGTVRHNLIIFKRKLKLSEKNGSYIISGATTPGSLYFSTKKDFPAATDSVSDVQVTEIINSDINKIGGTKSVIFSVNKVFQDPRALVFTYYKTIRQ